MRTPLAVRNGYILHEPLVYSFRCGSRGRRWRIHDKHLLRAGKIEPDERASPFLLRGFERLLIFRLQWYRGLELHAERVDECTFAGDAVVEMGPCSQTSRTYITNDLALLHLFSSSNADRESGEMAIHGTELTAMLDLNEPPKSVVPAGNCHTAAACGVNRRARRSRIVNTQVGPENTQDGMKAPSGKFRADSREFERRLQQVAPQRTAGSIVKLGVTVGVGKPKSRIDFSLVA